MNAIIPNEGIANKNGNTIVSHRKPKLPNLTFFLLHLDSPHDCSLLFYDIPQSSEQPQLINTAGYKLKLLKLLFNLMKKP